MACSMVKKGLVGTALGTGALYLVFGTSAPSYVRTTFHRVRENAKHQVPVEFEIDRARDEIARLERPLKDQLEILARAEVDVEQLDREIAVVRTNHNNEKVAITTLKNSLNTGDLKLAGNITYTADDVKGHLTQRFDHYKQVGDQLRSMEETLKAKQKAVIAARQQLAQVSAAKRTLQAKLDGIEARHKLIETTRDSNEFNFDGSALALAKASVAELEKRLDVDARRAELEGKYAGGSMPVVVDPNRDVMRELDAEFGPAPAKPAAGDDKNL